ncbi:hypothetical protein J437_LFUL001577 [Ladona fulva]|uniref:Uncharacterized protein n=1 Tax=Ladona fulva TaxID=123851 RepID=A0A8K0KJ05_LADFU|nr:hypothetical protein J437_LFUL001577 [Ladona fulva]
MRNATEEAPAANGGGAEAVVVNGGGPEEEEASGAAANGAEATAEEAPAAAEAAKEGKPKKEKKVKKKWSLRSISFSRREKVKPKDESSKNGEVAKEEAAEVSTVCIVTPAAICPPNDATGLPDLLSALLSLYSLLMVT